MCALRHGNRAVCTAICEGGTQYQAKSGQGHDKSRATGLYTLSSCVWTHIPVSIYCITGHRGVGLPGRKKKSTHVRNQSAGGAVQLRLQAHSSDAVARVSGSGSSLDVPQACSVYQDSLCLPFRVGRGKWMSSRMSRTRKHHVFFAGERNTLRVIASRTLSWRSWVNRLTRHAKCRRWLTIILIIITILIS